jgi:hypothetical protein
MRVYFLYAVDVPSGYNQSSCYSTCRPLQEFRSPPFHQHRFDLTPLLKQESAFDTYVGTIISLVGKILDCRMNQAQQFHSRSRGNVNVNVRAGRTSRPP